jgi:hypothetical protein
MEDKKNNILSSILNINDFNKLYNPEKNISVNFLTIYEKTQLLGLRKEQIAGGAETTLDDNEIPENPTIDDIVNLEFEKLKIPFMIKRTFNNGDVEFWKLSDLHDFN